LYFVVFLNSKLPCEFYHIISEGISWSFEYFGVGLLL